MRIGHRGVPYFFESWKREVGLKMVQAVFNTLTSNLSLPKSQYGGLFMFLMIDNYDSFTYILVDYFRRLGNRMEVFRHDEITPEEIAEMHPRAIVVSPGPKDPDNAGITIPVIRRVAGEIPMLGVCLGHQAMGQVFGGKVVRAPRLMHGKTSMIYHNKKGLFKGFPLPFEATRYHSLIIDPGSVPSSLEVTAYTSEGEIMGVSHRDIPVEGVQFHPESILTESGDRILINFMEMVDGFHRKKGEVINAAHS